MKRAESLSECVTLDQWIKENNVEIKSILNFTHGLKSDLEELAQRLGVDLEIVVIDNS